MSAPEVALPETLAGYTSDEALYCQNEQCGAFYARSTLVPPATNACPACGGALEGVSLGERIILPPDTQFRRRIYRSSAGSQFLVSAVIGGETKNSIHRPELCLPAQGYLLGGSIDLVAAGRPYHAVQMTPPGGPPSTMAYTFFNQEGFRTSSHLRRIFVDVWDRSVHNRIDRWVMVTVHASAPGGFTAMSSADRRMLEAFLSRLSEGLQ